MNLPAVIRALRPKQWTKNAVVFAALVFAAGDRTQDIRLAGAALTVLAAAALFCLASSAIYLLNDIKDLHLDRAHPEKKNRPIASGEVSAGLAYSLAVMLLAVSAGGAFLLSRDLGIVIAGYLGLQFLYIHVLKRFALVDLFVIAIGFVLRAMAGAVSISVTISPWLLLCTLLLALFLALCKRRQEMTSHENAGNTTRPSLGGYNEKVLDQLIAMTGAATLVCYALYTQWPDTVDKFGTHRLGFTLPFVLFGLFRYVTLVYHHQQGERPEQVLLTDPPLLITVGLYAAATLAILVF